MTAWLIYLEFLKIGMFAVGGGLAVLPFLYQLAAADSILAAPDIPDMLAAAQLLPGAIGVNLAAYTGARISPLGACLAVLGLITPPVAIITVVAHGYKRLSGNTAVQRIIDGLTPAATGLICAAVFQVLKLSLYNTQALFWYQMLRGRETLLLAAFFILVHIFKKLHPAVFIGLGGLTGILLNL